jgi:hypothetical protein
MGSSDEAWRLLLLGRTFLSYRILRRDERLNIDQVTSLPQAYEALTRILRDKCTVPSPVAISLKMALTPTFA